MTLLDHPEIDRLIQLALDEDGVANDLTTRATGADAKTPKSIRATIVAKKQTIACGAPMIDKVIKAAGMEKSIRASRLAEEGALLKSGSPWIIFEGNASNLLSVERTILNFLMRMCGIATYTANVVRAIEGTGAKILHTRKTAPGHRRTDIYAALTGGAHAHRRSLDDAILVKENHLRTTPSFQVLIDGIDSLRAQASFVEIEVTDFVELKHALMAKPNRILLDNFSIENVAKAVQIFGGGVELEASGNITLENVRSYAETGVDYISMGSLTHSAPSADLSLLFDFSDS